METQEAEAAQAVSVPTSPSNDNLNREAGHGYIIATELSLHEILSLYLPRLSWYRSPLHEEAWLNVEQPTIKKLFKKFITEKAGFFSVYKGMFKMWSMFHDHVNIPNTAELYI